MKRISRSLFLIILSIFLLTACTQQGTPENSVTVTDQKGREITIAGPVEKIVSLAPSNTETLFALGVGDKVVGITEYCNYPEEVANIEKMGGFEGPNVEKIVAAMPDVVFTTTVSQETVETLDQAGISVVVIDAKSMDSIYESIAIIGKVCDVNDEANALIADMKARIEAVQAKVQNITADDKRVVYYEVWHDPPMTVGPNTFLNEVITLAGAKNLSEDADTDWPSYSAEEIINKSPDVILLGHGGQLADAVKDRTGWDLISAVKNDKIVAVDQDVFSRPGPRVVEAIEFLAKYTYPNLFN